MWTDDSDCFRFNFSVSNATGVDEASKPEPKSYTDDEISKIIDHVIKEMDVDNDGWITYAEFIRGK